MHIEQATELIGFYLDPKIHALLGFSEFLYIYLLNQHTYIQQYIM